MLRTKRLHTPLTVTTDEREHDFARPAVDSQAPAATAGEMTYEQALSLAAQEGLLLVRHNNSTGFKGVTLSHCSLRSPFQAHSRLRGKKVHLGVFATAWEAALCYSRRVGPEQARREADEAAAAGVTGAVTTPRRDGGSPQELFLSTDGDEDRSVSVGTDNQTLTPEFKFSHCPFSAGVDGEATKAALTLQTLGGWVPSAIHIHAPTQRPGVGQRWSGRSEPMREPLPT